MDSSRRYRYTLSRERDSGDGTCLFIMLNPSAADAERDDLTIRRCSGFAARWGYRRMEAVNLFALRATDPRDLLASDDPVGPANDERIEAAMLRADFAVAAWGDHGAVHARSAWVMRKATALGVLLWSLRLNRSGEPSHPLYIPASAEPVRLIVTANMLG